VKELQMKAALAALQKLEFVNAERHQIAILFHLPKRIASRDHYLLPEKQDFLIVVEKKHMLEGKSVNMVHQTPVEYIENALKHIENRKSVELEFEGAADKKLKGFEGEVQVLVPRLE
jgi:hypothetical protein